MPAARLFGLLVVATVLTAASAAVPQFALVALAIDAVVLLAFAIDRARAARSELRAQRVLPPTLIQGADAEVRVHLERSGRRPLRVWLREGLAPALAEAPVRAIFEVAPSHPRAWRYTIRPRHRGSHTVAPLVARVAGPWGLAWSQRVLIEAAPVRIYPQVRWEGEVGKLLLLAHRRALGHSPRRARGQGSEPYALRSYRAGDPPGKIHWKASARHGTLISRQDTWERGARLVILLDCGRAMSSIDGVRSKLDHALAAALALLRVAVSRGDQVTVAAFSDRIVRSVRVRGSRGVHSAYAALYDVQAELVEPAYDLAVEHAARVEKRQATTVMLTSVVDLAAADLLRGSLLELERRHRPILINLGDPELSALIATPPDTAADVFATAAALDIRDANQRLASELRHAGIRAVTTPADRLALATLESYLALFGRRAA